MQIHAAEAEQTYLLETARAMAAAARTAPKTKGADFLETLILTGDDLEKLAGAMDALFEEQGAPFFKRDAGCVRRSGAVLVLGIGHHCRGFDKLCGYCGLDCGRCRAAGAACVFDPVDLGIAAGSAVSVAADRRVDTRIMLSAGLGAMRLGLLPEDTDIVYAIPLSISGKSPYFDR